MKKVIITTIVAMFIMGGVVYAQSLTSQPNTEIDNVIITSCPAYKDFCESEMRNAIQGSKDAFNALDGDELNAHIAGIPMITAERDAFWDEVWEVYKHTFIGRRTLDELEAFSAYMLGTADTTLCAVLGFASPYCIHCR